MQIDKEEIIRLTEEFGGEWGINHTRRLLHLVSIIGAGEKYDPDAVWLAAHLHDWGAYSKWAKPGVDHAVRSTEVAKKFLEDKNFPNDKVELILECIRTHHSGESNRSLEAILLSDADGLDFLGAIGILRDFSKAAKDLRKGFDAAKKRSESIPALLRLEKSKGLAKDRLQEMDKILNAFEQSSFGYF
jgi:uncharacterized protein